MSYVYFIAPEAVFYRSEESLQVVKIGFTRYHPNRRMYDLQTVSPVTLELLAFIDGDVQLERAFHDTFMELRSHGEWFILDGKLHDFLAYFDGLPPENRYVPRERLLVSMYDNIFASCSSHPRWTDDEYLRTANTEYLHRWFPEVLEA